MCRSTAAASGSGLPRTGERVKIGAALLQLGGDHLGVDRLLRVERGQAAHQVLQLPHVAGPAVLAQPIHRGLIERLGRQPGVARLVEEVARQHWDVLHPLTQRRQPDRHHVQAIEQILAKLAGADRLAQVAMGRGHDPHVGADRLAPANRGEFALLQHAQQPCLRLGRHVADLVEEQRPPRRLLEAALRPVERPGEGPALVPEQLALDQLARDRRHVDGDERSSAATPIVMQRAGHQLLAGAGLAVDHDGQVRGREPGNAAIDLLHRHRPPDQRQPLLRVRAVSRSGRLLWRRSGQRPAHDGKQFL